MQMIRNNSGYILIWAVVATLLVMAFAIGHEFRGGNEWLYAHAVHQYATAHPMTGAILEVLAK